MLLNKILLLILFSSLFLTGFAQQTDTIYNYLDEEEMPVDRNVSVYQIKLYKVNPADYDWKRELYKKSILVSNGRSKDKQGLIKQGDFTYYSADGKITETGRFYENEKEGEWNEWFENGKPSSCYHYRNGKRVDSNIGWYESGNPSDSSMLDHNGNGWSISYFKDGNKRYRGNYKNSLKSGLWEYYYDLPANNKSMEINYEADSVLSQLCFTETGTVQNGNCVFEKEARFPGPESAWRDYLVKKITDSDFTRYMKRSSQYRVIVKFVITREGLVSAIVVQNPGSNKKLDKLAISIIEQSPAWEPAMQYNRRVNAYRLQPINFVTE